MKGILTLELFGEDVRQLFKIYRGIFEVSGGDFGRAYFDKYIGTPSRASWVAEITGPDERYGLSRSFLQCKIDYSKSNNIGSRGIFAEFILSQGKTYEVNDRVSWERSERYFCAVNDEGDIVRLDEVEVFHSMGVLTREERMARKRLKIAEITGPDDQYLLARKFLNCSFSYSSHLQFPDYPGYELCEGKIYEVRERLSSGRADCYYITVGENGTIIKIDETCAYHSVGALTREERREKLYAERISRNQRS